MKDMGSDERYFCSMSATQYEDDSKVKKANW